MKFGNILFRRRFYILFLFFIFCILEINYCLESLEKAGIGSDKAQIKTNSEFAKKRKSLAKKSLNHSRKHKVSRKKQANDSTEIQENLNKTFIICDSNKETSFEQDTPIRMYRTEESSSNKNYMSLNSDAMDDIKNKNGNLQKDEKDQKPNDDKKGEKDTLLKSMYRSLNQTIVEKDIYTFKNLNRKYDFRILDKELEEIFHLMLLKNEKKLTTNGIRDFIHFFMNSYNQCDENKDNVLTIKEFTQCMKSDKFLSQIVTVTDSFSSKKNLLYNYSSYSDKFFGLLFESLDEKEVGYLNFNDYMNLRLMVFSWRKCSIFAPFLEENDFECAIEVVAGYKTLSRTLVRKIFFLALDLSSSSGNRALDFITYVNVAGSIKLYSKINGKQDEDITRNEFNIALDGNMIPMRYNQEIINQLFIIMQDQDKPNQGIDLQSFIFYDFYLKMFYRAGKTRPFYINKQEFSSLLKNPLFPNRTLHEVYLIPQYEFTEQSYQMYQYYNISHFNSEDNFLYKSFIETKNDMGLLTEAGLKNLHKEGLKAKAYNFKAEKKAEMNLNLRANNLKATASAKSGTRVRASASEENNFSSGLLSSKHRWSDFDIDLFTNKLMNNLNFPGFLDGKNSFNITLDLNKTIDKIFNALDLDFDGYTEFKDFAFFIHVVYVFSKEDKFGKGKISAGSLFDLFNNYADYPVISWKVRESSKRLSLFDMNTMIDPLDAYLILHIDSIAKYFFRLGDTQTLNEIEAKKFLLKMNMRYIPDAYLNRCLRGVDYNNLPKYEWECCFIQGMNLNLNYYETMDNYLSVKMNNISLSNTVFYNIDPRFIK